MRLTKAGLTLVVALAAAVASSAAFADRRGSGHRHAHGGHVRFGVVIGAPLFFPPYYPGYYPGPYYHYPPAVVAVPASPPVYVEQNAAAPEQGSYWYYCADAKTYYPYVKECPGGWQRVAPQPPPQ